MQTSLTQTLLETSAGMEADEILRNCVHCGFCNATCPTYQLTGDELDGPRGRIYLIKQVLEGHTATRKTQSHLDRCLTCRACETTCPSGVDYHHLLDTGRELIEQTVPRSFQDRFMRRALRLVLPRPAIFTPLLRAGQFVRPLLPATLKKRIPAYRKPGSALPVRQHTRSVLLLNGCVQPSLAPQINNATIRVLDALGISTIMENTSGCCGALSYHLSATDEAKDFMRTNIDAWWPLIERGAEAIVITASGCAPMVKEYGSQLASDPAYAEKAGRVSELAKDISEVISRELATDVFDSPASKQRIAFHSPCTLQHAQRINGSVEDILDKLGYVLLPVENSHLCCGSAGTYSILEPALASTLRNNKLATLEAGKPDMIVTANIGCLMHMETHTEVPVRHWIELIEPLVRNVNTGVHT